MPISFTDVRAVLPDRVTDRTNVVVEEGVIVEIGAAAAPAGAIDGHGALLLPGLIDTHSDGLEKEISPRPYRPLSTRLRAPILRGPSPRRGRHHRLPRHRLPGEAQRRPVRRAGQGVLCGDRGPSG